MHFSLVADLKILQFVTNRLDLINSLISLCGIPSDSDLHGFHDHLGGFWRQYVCIAHSMCTGFWTVVGNVPWLVTVVTDLRWVLGLHLI